MKNGLFVTIMLAALCAGAQQSSQPKSSDQPAQSQSASQPTPSQSDNSARQQADKSAQPSDKNTKDATKPQTSTMPAAAPAAFSRIPVVCLERTAWWVHMDPTVAFTSGDFTLSDDSIQWQYSRKTFSVQISDIRSLERKSAPGGLRYLRILPRNGKKFDFFPAQATRWFEYAGDETLAAVEKATRDRASQHGVVLK